MNKQIFALVAILATFNVAYSACDATTGTITMGVCQYHNVESLCKTWTSAKVCATCATDSTAVTAAGVCACGETDKGNFGYDNSTPAVLKCLSTASGSTVQPSSCPPGMMSHTDAEPCIAGDIWGCKTYDLTKAAAAKACTTCYDGVTYDATNVCANAGKNVIRGVGYVDSCPDGYVAAAAGDNQDCLLCAPGCATCAVADLTKCTGCAAGHLLVSDACVVVDTTNACDATCATGKCQTTATNCTECAADHWQVGPFSATNSAANCVAATAWKNSITGCTEAAADSTDMCAKCDTDLTLSADGKKCDCTATDKGYQLFTTYTAADSTADPAVVEQKMGAFCTACATACESPKICRASADHKSVSCVEPPKPPAEESTCEDAALKKAGCKTCAKPEGSETFECSACLGGFAALDADKKCPCVNDNKQVMYVDSNQVGRCGTCATECDAAKFCVINADGTDGTCGDTAATNDADTTTDSANILTAALAILAIILA